ncbi:MAG: CRISPR-associated endonuclease Cas2 [SAR324 cluster bacterium]|nr:CRISPR-associated endonuclease Cas2 [SAR324 cluster bacterium]
MKAEIFLIVYDIADEKRLHKIAKIMENYGVRVQKSVFEAALSEISKRNLKIDILQVIDPVEDGVKFFRLCVRCHQRINLIGKGAQPDLLQRVQII